MYRIVQAKFISNPVEYLVLEMSNVKIRIYAQLNVNPKTTSNLQNKLAPNPAS